MTPSARRSADPAEAERVLERCDLCVQVFRRVHAIVTACGPCDLRVATTQVGWARRRGFAYLWLPGQRPATPAAQVVLTVALRRRDPSPRWKEVVEATPGLFVHRLEVLDEAEVDDDVAAWLQESFTHVG